MGLEREWGPEDYEIVAYIASYKPHRKQYLIHCPGSNGKKGGGGAADIDLNYYGRSGKPYKYFNSIDEVLDFLYTIPIDTD